MIPVEYVADGGVDPVRASDMAAGYDLYANLPDHPLGAPLRIYPGQTVKVGTGVRLNIRRPDVCAVILPRSGLGSRGLVLGNTVGLIDPDYQGELIVALWNRNEPGDGPIPICHGERIAQLVFLPVIHPNLIRVDRFAETTARGDGGFGHTGKR